MGRQIVCVDPGVLGDLRRGDGPNAAHPLVNLGERNSKDSIIQKWCGREKTTSLLVP